MRKKTNNNSEFNHFSQLSNEWWDLNGAFKALHSYNFVRINYVKNSRNPQSLSSQQLVGKKLNKEINKNSLISLKDITQKEELDKLKTTHATLIHRREKGKGRPTKKERRNMDKFRSQS